MLFNKLDVAADEPADPTEYRPGFLAPRIDPTQALTPVPGERYRVVFADRWRNGSFHNWACYTVEEVGRATLTLRGYGATFPRNEVQFFPL